MATTSEVTAILEKYVKLQTTLLAIKMVKNSNEIPSGIKRPKKDLHGELTLCQAITLCRKSGMSLVLDKHSQTCPIALAGLGFVEPKEFLSGEHVIIPVNQSVSARKNIVQNIPRFTYGEYAYILIAPLQSAEFEPDMLLLYGNSAQIMRCIQSAAFSAGEPTVSQSTGSCGCLHEIVTPIKEKRCVFSIPGNGARLVGLVSDDELSFSIPQDRIKDIVDGLKLTHEGFQSYPICPVSLQIEHELPPPYLALRTLLLEQSQ